MNYWIWLNHDDSFCLRVAQVGAVYPEETGDFIRVVFVRPQEIIENQLITFREKSL